MREVLDLKYPLFAFIIRPHDIENNWITADKRRTYRVGASNNTAVFARRGLLRNRFDIANVLECVIAIRAILEVVLFNLKRAEIFLNAKTDFSEVGGEL